MSSMPKVFTVLATLLLLPTSSSTRWIHLQSLEVARIYISTHSQENVFTYLTTIRGGARAAETTTPTRKTFLSHIPFLQPFLSLISPKTSSSLLDILQEQIRHLQRQVRTYQEEIRQLRYLIQHQSSSRREDTSSSIRQYKIREEALLQQVDQLQLNLNTLITTQASLEKAYQTVQENYIQLQKQSDQNCKHLEIQAKKELESLQKTLLEQSKQQVQLLKEEMNHKMKQALGEQVQKGQEELEKERMKWKVEIEKEREKMRLLVKALAEKEKKNISMEKDAKKEKKKETSKTYDDPSKSRIDSNKKDTKHTRDGKEGERSTAKTATSSTSMTQSVGITRNLGNTPFKETSIVK